MSDNVIFSFYPSQSHQNSINFDRTSIEDIVKLSQWDFNSRNVGCLTGINKDN